jgi:hypothetical protein
MDLYKYEIEELENRKEEKEVEQVINKFSL